MYLPGDVTDLAELRERTSVFRDRGHAGEVLAELVGRRRDALVLAIPAGGVPVAVPLARALGLPLDLAVVSKITLPWNTESGYGAVAFDGTVRLNEELLPYLRLTRDEIDAGIAATREKVRRRLRELRGDRAEVEAVGREVLLVDDGLASGFTMRVAIEAARGLGAGRVVVAVPTGHLSSVLSMAGEPDELCCANIRSGRAFAVADAYQHWRDVTEEEVRDLLAQGEALEAPVRPG